jgi:GNAT superfamily N-acetyltransferase
MDSRLQSIGRIRSIRSIPSCRWTVTGWIARTPLLGSCPAASVRGLMPEITRFRPEDRPAIDALFRRVWGDEAAEAFHARWEWTYLENPRMPREGPLIWVAREGDAIVGTFATIPVRLAVHGAEVEAAWGTDAMVAPEQRGKGIGEALYGVWKRGVGAPMTVNMTDASEKLFTKIGFPFVGRVPRHAKPVSPNAYAQWKRRPPSRVARALAWWRSRAAARRVGGEVRTVARFDDSFTRLWERVAPKLAFAVRRDAEYLEWRYARPPHVRYSTAALVRGGETTAFVVYRHLQDGPWRVTMVVDFLADPDDRGALATLLDHVEREARAAGSDFLRAYVLHDAFRAAFVAAGYVAGTDALRFVAEVNSVPVPPDYYASTGGWHITRGDSDGDR